MNGIRDHISLHADALVLREKRNNVLASNIANSATPGYKARDIDFASAFKQAQGVGNLRTSDDQHFSVGNPSANGLAFRQNLNPSLDGNTVELAVEQMEFSQNTMRYQASLMLLNRKIAGLQNAIKGE
ncbi:flagellar basal body rod protein FlgB [Donghicola tyrosinivorans]|jgi:flagellar basal-body rod protein FlgB|uniref:Flagellar basal body rod protein FlgB n=1 Tax=Donghicola tyrosinivorans TaxID=1652492 RepID=A0A2T0WIH2_9RHOB|nr:flagellar basal body rod protein FlgB [Donghicola tyrosinivorans]MEC9199792.1 flagellar basal body rod protein FlgB [Pseudomonadota bacterium]MEE3070767.1 flagellar basal body rod protein FlgB [Pseudomonadota bacterium]PRY86499.1 flagellar basal-body rod protein FlgB [Donghicola tyrosinivorans]